LCGSETATFISVASMFLQRGYLPSLKEKGLCLIVLRTPSSPHQRLRRLGRHFTNASNAIAWFFASQKDGDEKWKRQF
jgi:hypothetical protein